MNKSQRLNWEVSGRNHQKFIDMIKQQKGDSVEMNRIMSINTPGVHLKDKSRDRQKKMSTQTLAPRPFKTIKIAVELAKLREDKKGEAALTMRETQVKLIPQASLPVISTHAHSPMRNSLPQSTTNQAGPSNLQTNSVQSTDTEIQKKFNNNVMNIPKSKKSFYEGIAMTPNISQKLWEAQCRKIDLDIKKITQLYKAKEKQ